METKTEDEKTHWKKQFNYDYLGSYSLPNGKDIVVTIKEMKKQMVKGVGGKEQECFVCYFTDSDKPMILNRTNCRTIEKLYGSGYIEDWPGKKIQLYAAKVNAFGTETDGLRIRDVKPAGTVDNKQALMLLNKCQDIKSLQSTYMALSKALQSDKDVIELKNKLKEKLK